MKRLPGAGHRYLETFRSCVAEAVYRGRVPAGALVGPPAAAPVDAAPPAQAPLAPQPELPADAPPLDEAGRIAALARRVHQVIGESEAGDRHWRRFI
eukprot:7501163-Alexandrium_andersonii.AAC.1